MILELSQYNSKQVIGNGEWVNNFAPITLQSGDSITVNQAFIDAQLSGDYDNIAISDDTTLTLTNGFYYMNLNDGDITYTKGPGAMFELYLARYATAPNPLLEETHTVNIPKGNYSPNEIAQIITSQLTNIPRVSITDFDNLGNMFLKAANGYPYSLSCKSFDWFGSQLTSLTASVVPIPGPIFAEIGANPTFNITATDNDGGKYSFKNVVSTVVQATGLITFAPIAVRGFGQTIGDIVCAKTGGTMNFFNPLDNTDSFIFTTNRYVGATQIALEYNINQTGKFQWTYQHMPMYGGASSGTTDDGIQVDEDENKILRFGDVRSGVFWTDLQPRAFWSGLGFDLSSLLVRDNPTTGLLETELERGVNITAGYVGLDIFIASSRLLPIVPTAKYFYATSQTTPIIAPNNYTGTDGGFYIIEVLGLATDYQDDSKTYCAVMSIGSRNYDQNGFITIYGDGSIPFINNGDPRTITTLHIRILDPITKQPTTLLGSRNSVFLNIQRTQPIAPPS